MVDCDKTIVIALLQYKDAIPLQIDMAVSLAQTIKLFLAWGHPQNRCSNFFYLGTHELVSWWLLQIFVLHRKALG